MMFNGPVFNYHLVDGFPEIWDKAAVRRWWHNILRNNGRYSCFAIFLVLPGDREATRYLNDFSRELYLVTGEYCLVLGIGTTDVQSSGFDEQLWKATVKEQVFEGYALRVAELFKIDITEFPCLILFRDIRSPDHVRVTLKEMSAEEISEKIRGIFTIVGKAASTKTDPLTAIENERDNEKFRKAGSSIISELHTFAGKTFEAVMQATVKAIISPGK
jgi:hypothetical protein